MILSDLCFLEFVSRENYSTGVTKRKPKINAESNIVGGLSIANVQVKAGPDGAVSKANAVSLGEITFSGTGASTTSVEGIYSIATGTAVASGVTKKEPKITASLDAGLDVFLNSSWP